MRDRTKVLRDWRLRRDFTASEVDQKMNWKKGLTSKYERVGFLHIPCCDLCKLVTLYDVPLAEFYHLLDSEIKRWRK